jgi:protein-S-isoprenylcysteine O-methyltransferase Ste14
MSVLVSESVLFRSVPILIYAAFVMACFHLFVVLHEEPNLLARFGTSYDNYRNAVPRWWIAWKPYEEGR